jgi:hypothetical protein
MWARTCLLLNLSDLLDDKAVENEAAGDEAADEVAAAADDNATVDDNVAHEVAVHQAAEGEVSADEAAVMTHNKAAMTVNNNATVAAAVVTADKAGGVGRAAIMYVYTVPNATVSYPTTHALHVPTKPTSSANCWCLRCWTRHCACRSDEKR